MASVMANCSATPMGDSGTQLRGGMVVVGGVHSARTGCPPTAWELAGLSIQAPGIRVPAYCPGHPTPCFFLPRQCLGGNAVSPRDQSPDRSLALSSPSPH